MMDGWIITWVDNKWINNGWLHGWIGWWMVAAWADGWMVTRMDGRLMDG